MSDVCSYGRVCARERGLFIHPHPSVGRSRYMYTLHLAQVLAGAWMTFMVQKASDIIK